MNNYICSFGRARYSCQNQSGFRANHSAVTALLEATDSWAYNIDAVIFLDLKKVSIKTKLLWFTWQILQYLENRTHKCSVNVSSALCNSCSLTCGVPQGTILRPFLLHINDFKFKFKFIEPP